MDAAPVLDLFSPVARQWFADAFLAPTEVQQQGWETIASGQHALLIAPTGSGKTLAAFLWCLDQLAVEPVPAERERCRVLYVSPLKALSYDVERNLVTPLAGLRVAAQRLGLAPPDLRVATRTGDTPQDERRDLLRHPPDVLITTPESLYLMLTSQAREVLNPVRWVILDEIHSVAGTKRGSHLALSLERLEWQLARARTGQAPAPGDAAFQRIGLSATVRPLDEIARYLGGTRRPVAIVDASAPKPLDLEVIVPVEDMVAPALGAGPDGEEDPRIAAAPDRNSIWPSVHARVLDLIEEHQSTLVFVNSRRLAERMAARLNEMVVERAEEAGVTPDPSAPPLVYAHHGSIARERRTFIEEQLKAGRIRGLVATSSLELGIDMGAIDLVVQVEAPPSVASGLQRIGRGGHSVGATSVGRIFPKYRGDLLETAVVVDRMRQGLVESIRVPANALDVLAQQVVALALEQSWSVDDLEQLVTGAYPYGGLGRDLLENVLDMLAGRYPSDEFAELKPRITWDREAGVIESRRDARMVAVTSGGTIPDRGLFPVLLGEGGPRIGEFDEENVYEARVGETWLLGASSWRIEKITPQQVIVQPAPGEPGKMPFWHGDGLGRPVELGRALGAFVRELAALDEAEALARLRERHAMDGRAAGNLLAYLAEEQSATGALPTDRTIVVERFRDELGDWRICILTPFGGRVHAPWALALERHLQEEHGLQVQTIWSDDGIAIRLPEGEIADLAGFALLDPERVEDLLVDALGLSALFASHFRQNAARALLLPRRGPRTRTPLWLQRQQSADLLQVASRYGSFPVILETYRECLQDVFDVPALVGLLRQLQSREVRVHAVDVAAASPFAGSLLFSYIAEFMYEGDAPLAERRAQALSLDRDLLRHLLGDDEIRDLLAPEALDEVELELQRLVPGRRATTADQVHDLLRRLGDLTGDEVLARCEGDGAGFLADLERSRRAVMVRIAGEARWIAVEDMARYRDALGVAPPPGTPDVFLGVTERPLEGLLLRFARTHTPFGTEEVAGRFGLPPGLVAEALERLARDGAVLGGEFRPGRQEREWCDPEVLRRLKRRSLAKLRQEIEPVAPDAYARFLGRWQGLGSDATGLDRLLEVVVQLEGLAMPASILETAVLPARVRGYQPRMLDELCAAGEVAWAGRGALGRDDGRVVLARLDRLGLLPPAGEPLEGAACEFVRGHLAARGASFFRELHLASGMPEATVLEALWDLVWNGEVSNDTMVPLRALRYRRRGGSGGRAGGRPRMPRLSRTGPPEAAGRWFLVAGGVPGGREGLTQRGHQQAQQLLERYGVVTREAAVAEGLAGGFAGVYPVFQAMEESGKVRRGYFVEGFGGAQFAVPGAVDRLRAERETGEQGEVLVLAVADPAQPYGALLPWPARDDRQRRGLQRAAGAKVVLVDGLACAYLRRNGTALDTLPAMDDPARTLAACVALAGLPGGDGRGLFLEKVDGEPVLESTWRPLLEEAGFRREYLGLRAARDAAGRGRIPGWGA